MLFTIGFVFTACQQENLAVGNTMKNKKASSYLLNLIKLKNDDSEMISLAALLGNKLHTSSYEQKLLNKVGNNLHDLRRPYLLKL